jgi:hypothetical protein
MIRKILIGSLLVFGLLSVDAKVKAPTVSLDDLEALDL